MHFRDSVDTVLTTSFLQEFVEARQTPGFSNAPPCLWSPSPPSRIARIFSESLSANAGFFSFVIVPRHVEERKMDRTVWSLLIFHAYVSYHVKALDHAKPDSEEEAKKSTQTRYFKRLTLKDGRFQLKLRLFAASSSRLLFKNYRTKLEQPKKSFEILRASSDESSDCNVEECAPDKEVGKVSVEWLAGDKTKVVGTFPPRKRGWTGYVEKDTAGQTNIYSVEPAVYVAESAISSGAAGSSADGSGNTVTVVAGIALVFVAAAASILFLVGKNQPATLTTDYLGPSLSYYINKFELQGILKASVSTATEAQITETPAPEILQPVESEQET